MRASLFFYTLLFSCASTAALIFVLLQFRHLNIGLLVLIWFILIVCGTTALGSLIQFVTIIIQTLRSKGRINHD